MSSKPLHGFLTLLDRDGNPVLQNGNISFLYTAKIRSLYKWNNNYTPSYQGYVWAQPWKQALLLTDDDINLGHGTFAGNANYPYDWSATQAPVNVYDYAHWRATGSYGTAVSTDIPRVFGSICCEVQGYTAVGNWGGGDAVQSIVDIPLDYTQIGIPYFHPAYINANTVDVTAGLSYVTYTNGQFYDQIYFGAGAFNMIRLNTGSDAGYYFITENDFTNNRLWLRCLNGKPFKAIATLAAVTVTACAGRRAWFNETSIIPLSVGAIDVTGGRFNPRKDDPYLRCSFIQRIVFEKSGSTEAATGTEQQGSYWLTMRPYTHGDGALTSTAVNQNDGTASNNYFAVPANAVGRTPGWFNNWSGGVNGMALDWENQRVWFGYTNAGPTASGIAYWRYKTSEGMREIATGTGGVAAQANFVTPAITLGTADVITDLEIGSNSGSSKSWVYVTIYHSSGGNAGVAIIKPDLTTLQYKYTTGAAGLVPSPVLAGCLVDKSRTRQGGATTASTNGSNQITATDGKFTSADIGRVIKLTNLGADNGTYMIFSIVGGTQVTVKTLTGAAVTFTSQSGGAFEIGDRLYLFFNNNTTGASKINYMESMAPGTFLSSALWATPPTFTNGANIATRTTGGANLRYGQKEMCSIDQTTGNIYWLSTDTQIQINKWDVSSNTHSFISGSNTSLVAPSGSVVVGGTSTTSVNAASPTVLSAIHVNSKFDDIWVGSDAGSFRISKSTFAPKMRYIGTETTGQFGRDANGSVVATGTGNGTTGLSYSAPNLTVNATGTPFTASMVGKYIMITGATATGNNGVFLITTFNSTSQIVCTVINNGGGTPATQANYAGTFYIVSSYGQKSDGSYQGNANTNYVRTFFEHVDGRMSCFLCAANSGTVDRAWFSQEVDNWFYKNSWTTSNSNEMGNEVHDPYGGFFYCYPSASGAQAVFLQGSYEVSYQWDGGNSKWIPLEVVQKGLPDRGAPDIQTNGQTTAGSATFIGSGFVASDAGKYFQIQTGGDVGVYRVSQFTDSTHVVLANINGSPFNPANTTGATLSYYKTDSTMCRGIHSTFQDTMYGVRVKFNRQGGATPPNNEYLGRGGQTRVTASDGSTTSGSGTFGGSSFVSGDVGKLLRIHAGADADVYRISAFTNSASITLVNLDGLAFSASATASGLSYSVWDLATPASNAGPEDVTVMLADGLGKDNTQDLTGLTYETFAGKTRLHEYDESRKFCTETPLAVPGSLATKAYFETYAKVNPQFDAATSHHRALPGAEFTNGRHVLDWQVNKLLNGAGSRATMQSGTAWYGALASTTQGWSFMADFGKDVEVGYVQIRWNCGAGQFAYTGLNVTANGLIGNLYKASDAAGTPVASTGGSPRVSGSNLNLTASSTTLTLTSGDWLGSITTGPNTNGSITAGQNTLVAPAATFVTADFMRILKVTAGAVGGDINSYRIIAVSGDGSTITVRNLDQTAKVWGTTASGVTYEVRNGVREEDMIAVPNKTATGVATQPKLCVERLLTTQTLQVRSAPTTTQTAQTWDCMAPTWAPVKRLSSSTEAQPPDVQNNSTWQSACYGREDTSDPLAAKVYFDITDLSTSQRTGRYWKFTAMPRNEASSGSETQQTLCTVEFYDPTGAKLGVSKYTMTDQTRLNPDFYFHWMSRADFVQGANDAMAGVSGFNGNVDLGGSNGDTLTLTTGGNKFLGFQVGPLAGDGNLPTGTNILNSASANWPASAMLGRTIRILTGAHAGEFYRVASRPSSTQVTLTKPSGTAFTWSATESSIQFTVHEGFTVGGSYPDKFAIRRMGTTGDVTTTVSTNQLNSASGAFSVADLGKFIVVKGATNDNGTYVIQNFVSSTQVLVANFSGTAVSFVGGSGGTFEFPNDLREYTPITINDTLTTITISESLQLATTNRLWEMRRPAYDAGTTTTVDATKSARLVRNGSTYPLQSGDMNGSDTLGHVRYFSEDVGTGFQRTDGSIVGGDGTITGSGFCSDDVGRLLYVMSGTATQANVGIYEIDQFNSATSVRVKNHYTGAAVSFTADSGANSTTYQIKGDRRLRFSKYITGLRQ